MVLGRCFRPLRVGMDLQAMTSLIWPINNWQPAVANYSRRVLYGWPWADELLPCLYSRGFRKW